MSLVWILLIPYFAIPLILIAVLFGRLKHLNQQQAAPASTLEVLLKTLAASIAGVGIGGLVFYIILAGPPTLLGDDGFAWLTMTPAIGLGSLAAIATANVVGKRLVAGSKAAAR